MNVDALGVSQEMDFKDGSVTNFLTLRLPSGDIIKALVSEAAVERIAANIASIQTGVPVAPPPAAPAPEAPSPAVSSNQDSFVYGGIPVAENIPPVRQKIVRVEADSRGNPIVQLAGKTSVMLEDKLGGGDAQDEDGIGQG